MKPVVRFFLVAAILAFTAGRGFCQTPIPEVLENGTLKEQMTYLEEKTRIYEYYRAIREDMFQIIKRNAVDSLVKAQRQISILAGMNRNLVSRIDTLTADVADLETRLDEAIKTKESIRVLGMNINKNAYNSIMWIILAALLATLGLGFVVFRTNLSSMLRTKKELEELKAEYESYRQKKRIEIEKLGMDHFNELRKLKGG
jgi:cell division protein FtsB